MNQKYIYGFLASMLLIFQTSYSQMGSDTVNLDEVVLSLPFNQTLGKSVNKVNKINLENINPILKSYISKSLSKLPGVSIISTGPGISKPSIRGLSSNRVLVYTQGVRLENQQWGADHGLGISQLGIGALEVIKGPNSLLYGVDAFGGVVYIEDEKFESQNAYSVNINSKFESVNLGYTNSALIKLSKKKFRFNLGALHSSFSDFQMPNGKYLADSRYQDMGVKTRISYNTNNLTTYSYISTTENYISTTGNYISPTKINL